MTESRIPDAFVFTKMQGDAGEDIDAIRRRKELERRAGGGEFWWGIGESKGAAIGGLCQTEPRPHVLFSLMLSRPSLQSREPGGVLLWQAYLTATGVKPLPPHVVVTSGALTRSGTIKRVYYALICRSRNSILGDGRGTLDAAALWNIGVPGKPVGSSQVTAVVKRVRNEPHAGGPYQIAARAFLTPPYCAQLEAPRKLTRGEQRLLRQMGAGGATVQEWQEVAKKLRKL